MSGAGEIVIERVNHTYRPARGRPVLALSEISLEVRPREFLALLGPSGSGKTTLLRIIAGLAFPDQGEVRFNGEDVTHLPVA